MWVVIPLLRDLPDPDWNQVSCILGRLYHWSYQEAPEGVGQKCIMASEVAVLSSGKDALRKALSPLLRTWSSAFSSFPYSHSKLSVSLSVLLLPPLTTHSHLMSPLFCKHYVKPYTHIYIGEKKNTCFPSIWLENSLWRETSFADKFLQPTGAVEGNL